MSSSWLRAAGFAALSLFILASCASSQQKLRREQREKAIQNTRLYCEFMNGEQYPDIDVAVNLAMSQKCDANGSMTVTNYKTPSEIPGILFCCSVHPRLIAPGKAEAPAALAAPATAPATKTPEPAKKPESKGEVKYEGGAAKAAPKSNAPTTSTTTEIKSEAKSYPLPEIQDVNSAAKSEVKTEIKTEVKTKTADPDLDE